MDKITDVVSTYSAESAGRMDKGERWELQGERREKDNKVRTSRTPQLPSQTDMEWPWRVWMLDSGSQNREEEEWQQQLHNEYIRLYFVLQSVSWKRMN